MCFPYLFGSKRKNKIHPHKFTFDKGHIIISNR